MTRAIDRRFLASFAIANAGGTIAYVPLLSLLVPLKIEGIAPGTRIELLSAVTIVGAIVASAANIGFGAASDRSRDRGGSRKPWIVAGMFVNALAYTALALAETGGTLIAAVVLAQIGINMILAPLGAILADAIPDRVTGVAGGALTLAPAAGSVVAALLTKAAGLSEAARFAIVAAAVPAMITPLLVLPICDAPSATPPPGYDRGVRRGDLLRLSLARLSVQTAGNVLFAYLLFYFEGLTQVSDLAPRIALLTMAGFVLAFPLGLIVGRWSDRSRRRKPALFACASAAAVALAVMGMCADAAIAALAYIAFAIATSMFLSLQATYALQILPSPTHRGRDLGFVNLANTLPALIGAGMVLGIVTRFGFAPFLLVLAALVLLGGTLTLTVRSVD